MALVEVGLSLYWYLTDFCINAANLLNMSYVEFNTILFLVTLPAIILVLLALNVFRYIILPITRLILKHLKG